MMVEMDNEILYKKSNNLDNLNEVDSEFVEDFEHEIDNTKNDRHYFISTCGKYGYYVGIIDYL